MAGPNGQLVQRWAGQEMGLQNSSCLAITSGLLVLKVSYAVSAAAVSVHLMDCVSPCVCLPIWRQKTQNTDPVRLILSPVVVRHLSMAVKQFCKSSLINTMRRARILQSKGQILQQAQLRAEAVLSAFAGSLYIPCHASTHSQRPAKTPHKADLGHHAGGKSKTYVSSPSSLWR